MLRHKVCSVCNTGFSYPMSSGRDRKYCGLDCSKKAKATKHSTRYERLAQCSVDDCTDKANRVNSGMCEKHYIRLRRNGHTDAKPIAGRYVTGAGYIKLLKPDHPLSDGKGQVFEHRYAVYQSLNGNADLSCYWCSVPVNWDSAVIDHLNECKSDNQLTNLVVSCNNCNRARGAIKSFIGRLSPRSLETFLDCAKQYHGMTNKP